jgi:hypothetical protein
MRRILVLLVCVWLNPGAVWADVEPFSHEHANTVTGAAHEYEDDPAGHVPELSGFEEPVLEIILRALDALLPTEERIEAIEELAGRGEARLVPVYSALLHDRRRPVMRASVRALGHVTEPTATEWLRRVVVASDDGAARLALEGLGRQQTDLAAATLHGLHESDRISRQRRDWSFSVLEARYPAFLAAHPTAPLPEREGLPFLVLAGGQAGGIMLMTAAQLGQGADIGAPIGYVTGSIIGLGASYLRGREHSFSLSHGYRTLSYQHWGLGYGLGLGSAIAHDGNYSLAAERRIRATATGIGALGGFGLGLFDDAPLSFHRQLMVDVSGLAALSTAGGILLWLEPTGRALPPALFLTGSSAAGLVSSRLLLPHLDLDEDHLPLLVSAPLLGAWFFPWTAAALNPDLAGDTVAGFAFVGAGAGWAAALTLGHYLDTSSREIIAGNTFAAYGTALGIGLPLVSGVENPGVAYRHIAGWGLGGLGLGIATAPYLEYDGADVGLIAGTTLYGAWQGGGFARYGRRGEDEVVGYTLLGGVGGAAAALGASQLFELTPAMTLALFSGKALGTWTAWVGGLRLGLEDRQLLLTSLLGTNVGLAATLGLTQGADVDPNYIAWAGAGGAVGAGLGALSVSFFTPELRHIQTGTLVGTAAGAGAASIFANAWIGQGEGKRARGGQGLTFAGFQPWSAATASDAREQGLVLHFLMD